MSEDEPKIARQPSGRDPLPGLLGRLRPPLSGKGTGKGKEAGGDAIPFVLGVYAASRLFYLLAGALLAGLLPAGGFYRITPDVPLGRLNIWTHWDGVWYSKIATEGYGAHAPASIAFFPCTRSWCAPSTRSSAVPSLWVQPLPWACWSRCCSCLLRYSSSTA